MKIRFVRSVVAMVLAVAPAAATAAEMKAEVIHWWTSGSESAAIGVFADQFAKEGGTWVDSAVAGGTNARAAGINRIVGGQPPTAMQFNTGKQFDDLIANGMLNDLDAVAAEEGWKEVLPAAFVDAVTRDGSIYAVPVNIHGQNWLWYNKAAFETAGAEVPKTWDDVLAAAEKLRAAGIIPLALGGQPWQERELFNAILLGQGGRDLYFSVFGDTDPEAVRGEEFLAVAQTYGALRDYVDAGSPGRNWNDATALVITGKAGMQVMGDWAKGEFVAAGQTPDREFGCALVGQQKSYMMGGDVFVFPRTDDPAQREAQAALARIMLEPETQIMFNKAKGSVPVRQDVDVAALDPCARQGVEALRDAENQIPDPEMLITADVQGALDDVLTEYWNSPGMTAEDFVDGFAAAIEMAE